MSKDQNLFPGDAYKTLGVHRSGTAAEIKAGWRALMVLHHPDKATGNPVDADRRTRKTAEINGAYESLKTSDRRQAYDTARPNDGKTADQMARERARSREPQPRPRTHTDRDSARDTGRRGGGIPWTDESLRAAADAGIRADRQRRESSPEYQARRRRSPVARFLRVFGYRVRN